VTLKATASGIYEREIASVPFLELEEIGIRHVYIRMLFYIYRR